MTIFDYQVQTIDGNETDLSEYKGKTVIIVNTASKCGLVSQLAGLEELYKDYKDKGLVVLGFPCNQFMNQEPLEGKEITEFCTLEYGVTFPIFDKLKVNGEDTHPLYRYLKEETGGKKIKWNYTKFLVNKDGVVVERFGSMTKPEKMREAIEKVL